MAIFIAERRRLYNVYIVVAACHPKENVTGVQTVVTKPVQRGWAVLPLPFTSVDTSQHARESEGFSST